MGIIETLSAGFDLVRRRLWLIVVPIVIDLFLWLGPRISIEPLVKRFESLLIPPASAQLTPADLEALQMSRNALLDVGSHFNLASLLPNTLLGVPSAMTGDMVDPVFTHPAVWQVSSGWSALGLVLVLLLGSVFIASLYLTLVAREVSIDSLDLSRLAGRVWIHGVRIIALGLALLAALAIFMVPVSVVSAVLALLHQGLALMWVGMFSLAAMWVGIAVMIYLLFAVDSIVLFGDGALRAARNSVMVVRRNLWSTLGLVLLTNLISIGLSFVWQRLAVISWGPLIGIVGNAYVGSGLVAAVLIFYRDRYQKLQTEMQKSKGKSQKAEASVR